MKLDESIQPTLAGLIEKGEAVLSSTSSRFGGDIVDIQPYAEWRSQSVVLLARVFGESHAYPAMFQAEVTERNYTTATQAGIGILRAALEDVAQGHLSTLQDMATAEVFSDFLDQADHLLQNGYLAPAASLAGAVLENGLRSTANHSGVTVRTRDDLSSLNNKLADKKVYSRLRQRQIAVWTEVRNTADHGHFDRLVESDVADLIKGARSFLAEML